MILVADANELFIALISRRKNLDLFFNSDLELVSPKFVLEEFNEHKEEVIKKSGLNKEEIEAFVELLSERINFFDKEEYKDFIQPASEITQDLDDVDYLALALKLNCPIWSEDKHFKMQNKIKIYTTREIIEKLKIGEAPQGKTSWHL